jgi:hypothetical protein
LFEFLFIDLLRSFHYSLLFFFGGFVSDGGDKGDLLCFVHVHHAAVGSDALIDQELLSYIYLHVVGIV